jgi:signal transduction histidine kinase
MELITVAWSMGAAAALTLGAVCGLAWSGERRDLGRLVFLFIALSVVAGMRCEVGMMHAATAAEFSQWLRWYHLPVFCVIVGYLFLIRLYLGTGRLSLAWTIGAMRLVILVINFSVDPNFNWREIDNLRHVSFLGEQVAVPGDIVVRWQWLSTASLLLMFVYVADACIARLRKAQPDSNRRVLAIAFAWVVPTFTIIPWTQFALIGVIHVPVVASPFFLFTLSVMAFELSREIIAGTRTRQEVAGLRGELAHVGRVTTLGQLASALTHELTQPLSALAVDIETAKVYLKSENPDLTELRAIVSDISTSDLHAEEILGRMRGLIKRRRIELQPLALTEVVEDAILLVRGEAMTRGVALDCNLQPALPITAGDRVHLSQVLLNLIINAMDAMQSPSIETRRIIIEARTAPAGTIEVAVRDSGPGIPDECIEKVFDPFYTTKFGGMGMGLALSRTIVEAHGGRIWAERNAEGTGATFRFTLRAA